MVEIISSAPNKIIITGEHAVVHGSWAIATPINLRNRIELSAADCGTSEEPEIFFEDVNEPEWRARLKASGAFEGNEVYKAFFEMAKHIFSKNGTNLEKVDKKLHAKLYYSYAPKGTGNSASIAAAFALALYAFLGKKPGRDELFETVQVSEKVVHGAPSGIDARTVISDKAQKFRKEFLPDGSVRFHFEDVELQLPSGTVLLIISPPSEEKMESTGELVTRFAQTHFHKNPGELNAEERTAITKPFDEIVAAIERELHAGGDAGKLGKLFNENHELLKKGDVSSPRIEEARRICLDNGALGAKLTGAGGNAGATIALAFAKDALKIEERLKAAGFKVIEARIAERGACIEKAA